MSVCVCVCVCLCVCVCVCVCDSVPIILTGNISLIPIEAHAISNQTIKVF